MQNSKEDMMRFIEWDQSLSIDIEEIDNQHKGLIEMINLLESYAKVPDRHKICFEKEHNEFIKNVLDFEIACVEFYSPYLPMRFSQRMVCETHKKYRHEYGYFFERKKVTS
jgi:hypothetical protein